MCAVREKGRGNGVKGGGDGAEQANVRSGGSERSGSGATTAYAKTKQHPTQPTSVSSFFLRKRLSSALHTYDGLDHHFLKLGRHRCGCSEQVGCVTVNSKERMFVSVHCSMSEWGRPFGARIFNGCTEKAHLSARTHAHACRQPASRLAKPPSFRSFSPVCAAGRDTFRGCTEKEQSFACAQTSIHRCQLAQFFALFPWLFLPSLRRAVRGNGPNLRRMHGKGKCACAQTRARRRAQEFSNLLTSLPQQLPSSSLSLSSFAAHTTPRIRVGCTGKRRLFARAHRHACADDA